jgi:serine protease
MGYKGWLFSAALACLSAPGVTLAQTALDDGFPQAISGAADSVTTYYLDVPAGTTNLGFTLEQGGGLAYMYVNYGSASTDPGTVDCQDGALCEFVDPQAGRWYVQVYGASQYANASLTGWSLTRLQKGDTVAGLAGAADTYRWFYVTVPGATKLLTATASGGTGNTSLVVVNAGTWQDILNGSGGTFCTSDEDPGNAESCTRTAPQAGAWLVFLYGDAAFSGVTLHVDYEEGSGGALTPAGLGGLLLAGILSLLRRRDTRRAP